MSYIRFRCVLSTDISVIVSHRHIYFFFAAHSTAATLHKRGSQLAEMKTEMNEANQALFSATESHQQQSNVTF